MARFGIVIGQFAYLAFYFWDRIIDSAHSNEALLVRIAVTASLVPIVFLPERIFVKHLQLWMTLVLLVAAIGLAAIVSIIQGGLTFGVGGFLLALMFNFGLFRLLFLPALMSGLSICLAYNVAAVLNDLSPSFLFANNFFLISALVSGAWITYLLERLFRAQFIAEEEKSRQQEALARQLQIDSRYLEWLRSLATFLRHEVRQPVAQINSSIELIQQLAEDSNQQLAPFITSASLGAQQVWNLIERASQATDAEAFVRQANLEWTNLTAIVTEETRAALQSYSGIKFQLEAAGPIYVRVDATLIREALSNLLGNATSFAYDDSTINVALELNGSGALIKVINKGPLIESDPEALFGPFTSTRLGPSGEHHGLGLYLVRLIAERHGGSASISNLDDRTGVQAAILLPGDGLVSGSRHRSYTKD